MGSEGFLGRVTNNGLTGCAFASLLLDAPVTAGSTLAVLRFLDGGVIGFWLVFSISGFILCFRHSCSCHQILQFQLILFEIVTMAAVLAEQQTKSRKLQNCALVVDRDPLDDDA